MENLTRKTKDELIAIVGDLEQKLAAAVSEKQILEGDLLEARNDLQQLQENADPIERKDCHCGETIAKLREIVALSCKDHCPHRGNMQACKNCTIYVRLQKLEEGK